MTGEKWVDLWFFDLAAQGAHLLETGRQRGLLDADAVERSTRFASARQAQHFLASRAALRLVLAEYGHERPAFAFGPHGKPVLAGVHFNLSRTTDAVIVAVASAEVGIDIEYRRPVELTEPLITETEALLLRLGWPETDHPRLRAWTAMEAWVKYHGLSMARLLDESALAARMVEELLSRSVEFTPLILPPHLCGTVCTTGGTAGRSSRCSFAVHPQGESVAKAPVRHVGRFP